MPDLQKILQRNLSGASRIALVAVGSDLRSDDAAGLEVAARLQELQKKRARTPRLRIFIGGTAPENQSGAIRKFGPSHMVVIDSADAGKPAGTVFAIDPEEVGGISFSTHQLPLRLMIEYLRETITCSVAIIGIQPKSLAFGGPISREVDRAVDRIVADLDAVLKSLLRAKGPAPQARRAHSAKRRLRFRTK
ncbi:MAG TPA: hydrogenase 3 maturation endopeptidase HyCI [bacterium]|nr:hydrogenase 3 maturation endopeptidase HyCI [bacterium]